MSQLTDESMHSTFGKSGASSLHISAAPMILRT